MTPRGGIYTSLDEYPPRAPRDRSSRLAVGLPLSVPPRPTWRALASTIVVGVLVAVVVAYPRHRLTTLERALLGEGLDYRLEFTQLYDRRAWQPIEVTSHDLSENVAAASSSWVDRVTDECVEGWIATGDVCDAWPAAGTSGRVDAVWTWSNGSDTLLSVWRAEVTALETGLVSQGISMVRAAKRARHFRDHGELRYSVRSALDAFTTDTFSKLHVLTPDLPANILLRDTIDPNSLAPRVVVVANESILVNSARIGQIPRWLSADPSLSVPSLSLVHHSNFFSNASHLPTFNSLAIESQFPHLSQLDCEFFLYLNDDTFLLGRDSLVATDVGSSLLGPVFRLQDDLTVASSSPRNPVLAPEGEWASLERANWLLDRRFGVRERNYLAHIPKAMSMPILREIGTLWREELEQTASSRFRGHDVEYQLAFLATHYTIESHRQALLFAFVVGRTDRDGDGVLSLDERHRMLQELGIDDLVDDETSTRHSGLQQVTVVVAAPYRSTRTRLGANLERAGLELPRSTRIGCLSGDGHCVSRAHERRWNPPVRYGDDERGASPESSSSTNGTTGYSAEPARAYCTIDSAKCFGVDFLLNDDSPSSSSSSALELFKRVSFTRPECGDCMIVHLVSTSGQVGMSSFLPRREEEEEEEEETQEAPPSTATATKSLATAGRRRRRPFNLVSLSSSKTFDELALAPSAPGQTRSRRVAAAREILRYSYVLGRSKSMFHGMRTPRDTERVLRQVTDDSVNISETDNLTFLTLNDDFSNDHVSELSQPILDDFFARTWPDPCPYEA